MKDSMKNYQIFVKAGILIILSIFLTMTISSCGLVSDADSNNEAETQAEDYPDELIHGYWLNEDGTVYLHFEEDGDFSYTDTNTYMDTYADSEIFVEGQFDLNGSYITLIFGDDTRVKCEYNQEEDSMFFLGVDETYYRATEDMLPEEKVNNDEYVFDATMVGRWDNTNDVIVEFDEYGYYEISSPDSSQHGTYRIVDMVLTMTDSNGSDMEVEYDSSDDTFWLDDFSWFYRLLSDEPYDYSNEIYTGLPLVGTWESLTSDSIVAFYEDGSLYFEYSEGDYVIGTYFYYFSDDSFMIEMDENGYDFSGGFYDPSDDTVYLDGWEGFVRLE